MSTIPVYFRAFTTETPDGEVSKSDQNLPILPVMPPPLNSDEVSSVDGSGIVSIDSFATDISISLNKIQTFSINADIKKRTFDDIYNRIYIFPPSSALGNVTSNVIINSKLWNAYVSKPALLESITGVRAGGIAVELQPQIIGTNTQIEFEVLVASTGEAIIDAEIRYKFAQLDGVSQYFKGSRLVAVGWTPQDNFVESLSWKTSVFMSENGSEERTALRDAPRGKYSPKAIMTREAALNFRNSLIANMSSQWGIQAVFEQTVLKDVVWPAGTNQIQIDTTTAQYEAGGYLYVYVKDGFDLSLGIASVTDTEITLKQPIETLVVSPEVRICPLRFGYINGTPSIKAIDGKGSTYETALTFDLNDDVDILDGGVVSTGIDFEGYSVLERHFEFSEGQTESIEKSTYDVDFGAAEWFRGSDWESSRSLRGCLIRFNNKEELWSLREFAYSQQGQLQAFYMPTFLNDLIISSPILKNSASIEIYNQKISSLGIENIPAIRIQYPDGSVEYNKITAVIDNENGTEQCFLQNSTINDEKVTSVYISRMPLLRMANDSIRFDHDQTGGTMKFTTVEVG